MICTSNEAVRHINIQRAGSASLCLFACLSERYFSNQNTQTLPVGANQKRTATNKRREQCAAAIITNIKQ